MKLENLAEGQVAHYRRRSSCCSWAPVSSTEIFMGAPRPKLTPERLNEY
jgi:hypothetical protein